MVHQSLPHLIARLVASLLQAYRGGPQSRPNAVPAAVSESAAADAVSALLPPPLAFWESAEGRFITFRLLGVLPWSAAAAAPSHTLAQRLGHLVDAVALLRTLLRRPATLWTLWALRCLDALTTARLLSYSAEVLRRITRRAVVP